jgi:hypothetical protein
MNTFKRILVALSLATGALLMAAPSEAATVSPQTCASPHTYNRPHSRIFHKCERRGWFYDVGSYVETDGRVVHYALVYGPRGHLWVDTQGWYTSYGSVSR